LNTETGEFVPVDNTGVLDVEAAAAARATVEALGDILQSSSAAAASAAAASVAAAGGEAAESLEEKKLRLLASLSMMDAEPSTVEVDLRPPEAEQVSQPADFEANSAVFAVSTAAPTTGAADPIADATDHTAADSMELDPAPAQSEAPMPGLALQIDALTVRVTAMPARSNAACMWHFAGRAAEAEVSGTVAEHEGPQGGARGTTARSAACGAACRRTCGSCRAGTAKEGGRRVPVYPWAEVLILLPTVRPDRPANARPRWSLSRGRDA
jgi:hypothetical protein